MKFENIVLQIRVIGSGENKSVLAIHQEKLSYENARSEMKK